MAFLFQKFQEAVKTLAKNPAFARDPRQLQFEVDINRLFLYTSYNRLGKNADEADAEEIIAIASKASVADQQMQVQENVHSQIKAFCTFMDEVLLPNEKMVNGPFELSHQANILPHCTGLSSPNALPKQRPLSQDEVSQKLKDQLGYTLNVKPSQISHKDAGQGLFLDGVADVGAVLAFYPGVVYSPAYYHYIPGYLDEKNPYLITRYDGTVIDAQPWGCGSDEQELWNGRKMVENKPDMEGAEKGSDSQKVNMKRFGSFWFQSGVSRKSESHVPTLRTVVLVATRALQDEELLLNYRLSNSKPWPEWYAPVDDEEDVRI
ncbi:uncharacterized protein LOC133306392 isoform X3 [Gastrolobium bilobum]|uniref:uncharacterized protein LOC133306392 isoform X3 n=1 Tax=Gastrolobium bilobum TaxID=150636 RepID=UPI002AB1499E|nr:uncharacterized protein LOC133306392 isoform X3 [Gastrolobium bilobum]